MGFQRVGGRVSGKVEGMDEGITPGEWCVCGGRPRPWTDGRREAYLLWYLEHAGKR